MTNVETKGYEARLTELGTVMDVLTDKPLAVQLADDVGDEVVAGEEAVTVQ